MTESKRTTLTREQLLSKVAKPRYEEVDVDGFGTIGIRERTRLQSSRRTFSLFDSRGNVDESKAALQPFWMIVDQVMVDENTPMFSESDVMTIANWPDGKADELFAAVQRFNEEVVDDPKKPEESSESSES